MDLADASWIWNADERDAYQHYVRFRRDFQLAEVPDQATLQLTADAYYQAWLNGTPLGHGPSKSAEGQRFVDTLEIAPHLEAGENRLEILVMSMGAGSMTYVPGLAGLIYRLEAGDTILVSDSQTQAIREPTRQQPSVRLWMQPSVDHVDALQEEVEWQAARVVESSHDLRPRRVPLPSRQACGVQRIVHADHVRLPNLSLSFRCRAMLLEGEERLANNRFNTPACFVTELVSPVDQPLELLPAIGSVDWYFEGERVTGGTGWKFSSPATIQLNKGANRLIGNHLPNHFEDASLCGWSAHPVEVRNPFGDGLVGVVPAAIDDFDASLAKNMPELSWLNGNPFDLAHNATVVPDSSFETNELVLPPSGAGQASRLIVDLGAVHHGWIACEATAQAGSRLIVSLCEYLEPGNPPAIQWPSTANNAISWRLREGQQQIETFHHYAGRYLILLHEGRAPVEVKHLRLLNANCGSQRQGSFRCSDPLLNDIYDIAVRTCISGVDDTFTDCPLFEQVNWNYDNRATFHGESLSIANLAVTRHSIALFAEDPRRDGLVMSQYPSSWRDNDIPNWSFHWIMWVRDYVALSGDLDFAREMYPQVATGIEQALARCRPDGLFSDPSAWHFIEWGPGRDDHGPVVSHEQACLAGAVDAAIWLADELGETNTHWTEARQRLADACNRLLWCDDRGAYADAMREDGTLSEVSSQTDNAALVAFDFATPEREARIIDHLQQDRLLQPGSPYGLFYILAALERYEDVETIFRHIRHRWGDMVRAGDKTLWEMFDQADGVHDATRSRCHPFSAYVIRYLLKYVLGYRGLDTDDRPVWAPNPPAGITSCEGAVPTRSGIAKHRWSC